VSCAQAFCHIAPAPPPSVNSLATDIDLLVAKPTPGEAFTSAEDVLLQWDAGGDASIAVVLGDAPPRTATASDVSRLAIWAIGLERAHTVEVHPATAGHPVVNSDVQTKTVGFDTRAAGPLYLLVQAVRQGTLLRASRLVPFQLGGTWPVPGSACAVSGTIPGTCASPAAALACIEGTCTLLCASHLDCATTGGTCGNAQRLANPSAAVGIWYRVCE
jgi:hypothetical protein